LRANDRQLWYNKSIRSHIVKVGDLVKMKRGYSSPGLVMRIDKDHYGADQAYKIYGAERGECLHPKMVNGIGPTRLGKQDRVMVLWTDEGYSYEYSKELKVINEIK
jgi:hypothetical protein